MSETKHILFLDDDHVLRLTRFALSGNSEVSNAWVQSFFSPLEIQTETVYDLAHGLHASDGVALYPLGTPAKLSTNLGHSARVSSHPAEILIFRRGIVDADLMAQHPNLKFIQRLGERRDGIDFVAAKARGIQISCLPRKTLQYTAEHSIMFMLALVPPLWFKVMDHRVMDWADGVFSRVNVHPAAHARLAARHDRAVDGAV